MRFWKFQIFEKCPGPIFQKPAKKCVLKMPPFVRFYFFKNPQKMVFEKIQIFEQLPGSKIPLLAIHKIISHIWEDRSRKVNNDEPDLRFWKNVRVPFFKNPQKMVLEKIQFCPDPNSHF